MAKGVLQDSVTHEEVQTCALLRDAPHTASIEDDARAAASLVDGLSGPLVPANPAVGAQLDVAPLQSQVPLPIVVEGRKNPALLVEVTSRGGMRSDGEPPAAARGLSPYMLELNRHMQSARMTKGSALSQQEMDRVRRDFRELWQRVGDRSVFEDAYQEWRHDSSRRPVAAPPKYTLLWDGGCRATPFTKEELVDHLQKQGWPSDAQARCVQSSQGERRAGRGLSCA